MFAECGFEGKELSNYETQLSRIQICLRTWTLKSCPDESLLWDKKTESDRLEQLQGDIDSHLSSVPAFFEKVEALKKSLAKLRAKKITSDPSLRTRTCHSMEDLLKYLPILTSEHELYRLQAQLLSQLREADAVRSSLDESSSTKVRQLAARYAHALKTRMEAIDATLKAIDAEFKSLGCPYVSLYDATSTVMCSLIEANRSVDLLCEVLKSVVKSKEITEAQMRMVSNLFGVVHSAMSIVATLKLTEEEREVERAFQILDAIISGDAVQYNNKNESEESVEKFNCLYSRLDVLLTEIMKAKKNTEKLGK